MVTYETSDRLVVMSETTIHRLIVTSEIGTWNS